MRKKVLFLITKSSMYGAGKYVFDLATNLDRERFECVIVAGGSGDLLTKAQEHGIKTIPLDGVERDVRLLKDVHILQQLISILRHEQPDVVHVNSAKLGGLGSVAGRLASVPRIVFTAHGWSFNEAHRSFLWKWLAYFFSWVTTIFTHRIITITHSDHTQGERMWFTGQKMRYIPNGIETPSLLSREEARRALGIPLDAIALGSIGELHKNKGYDIALDALSHIEEPFHYSILGDGEERILLEQTISARELNSRITLHGFVPNASEYLKAFDVFIHPSRKEGLSYVILEAALAGLPVIATRIGGNPDILGTQSDMLITPESATELHQKLVSLLASPPKRTGVAALLHGRVQEHFTLDTMVTNITALYEG